MKFQILIVAFSFITTIMAGPNLKPKVPVVVSEAEICKTSRLPPDVGQQLTSGACSSTQLGEIPTVDKMTSTIIVQPKNAARIRANIPFNVTIMVANLKTGLFSDPDAEYYTKSQSLDEAGFIKGHSHITVQSFHHNKVPDPRDFAFFKGLNESDRNGILQVTVDGLLPGHYRICTLASSFSHQPIIMPVAKRGPQDDCIRIRVDK